MDYKSHIISILQTFVSALLLAIAASVASGMTLQWTSAFWISLIIAAVRQAVKITWQNVLPVSVGGKPRQNK